MGKGIVKINPFREFYRTCYSSTATADFPVIIDVELTNMCNFTCDMCPIGQDSIKRPRGFMADETWQMILKELSLRKTPVRFVRWGEPTIHPSLYEYIEEAAKYGILTHLTTNGSKLDVNSLPVGLGSIKFSVHDWPGVFDVARELYHKKYRPYITIAGYSNIQIPPDCSDESMYMKVRDLSEPSEEYHPCPEVFSKLSIDWDGRVTACCGDYDRKMIIGDIYKETLAEIWLSKKMEYYRKMLSEMRHAELPLCRSCVREKWNAG